MKNRPKPLTLAQVETIRMVCGGEKKIKTIIHKGVVKDWVGIGWIDLREAKPADYLKYPEVLCQQPQKNGKSSSPKKTRKRCSSTTSTKR